jgi:hypothetical protein
MDSQRTEDQLSKGIRPARKMTIGLTANVNGDAGGKPADEHRDGTMHSSEDAVAPIGGPEYTGRA